MAVKTLLMSTILALGASAASGDVLLLDTIEQGTVSTAQRPARGSTMNSVEASFGAPAQRAAPVGEPPITRWEYPGFVVYFEHQRVLHAVPRR
jgi:hypothetical protein